MYSYDLRKFLTIRDTFCERIIHILCISNSVFPEDIHRIIHKIILVLLVFSFGLNFNQLRVENVHIAVHYCVHFNLLSWFGQLSSKWDFQKKSYKLFNSIQFNSVQNLYSTNSSQCTLQENKFQFNNTYIPFSLIFFLAADCIESLTLNVFETFSELFKPSCCDSCNDTDSILLSLYNIYLSILNGVTSFRDKLSAPENPCTWMNEDIILFRICFKVENLSKSAKLELHRLYLKELIT